MMKLHVPLAIGADLQNTGPRLTDAFAEQASKLLPGLDFPELQPIKPSRRLEGKAVRCAEVGLKVFRVPFLRQKRKDPSAIVVDQDDGRLQPVFLGGEKPVHIVIEREISHNQDQRLRKRSAETEGGGKNRSEERRVGKE